MRKVIQISATTVRTESGPCCDTVFALCDDGSIYVTEQRSGSPGWLEWSLIPEVPQGQKENTP
jgi:hypothetical protein